MAITEETEALMLAYVYGELSTSEARAFERRLADDADLRAEVESMKATHDLFGRDAAHGLASGIDLPPAHLVDAIMNAEALARPPEVRQAALAARDQRQLAASAPSSKSFTAKLSRWLLGGGVAVGAAAAVLIVVTSKADFAAEQLAMPTSAEQPASPAAAAAPALADGAPGRDDAKVGADLENVADATGAAATGSAANGVLAGDVAAAPADSPMVAHGVPAEAPPPPEPAPEPEPNADPAAAQAGAVRDERARGAEQRETAEGEQGGADGKKLRQEASRFFEDSLNRVPVATATPPATSPRKPAPAGPQARPAETEADEGQRFGVSKDRGDAPAKGKAKKSSSAARLADEGDGDDYDAAGADDDGVAAGRSGGGGSGSGSGLLIVEEKQASGEAVRKLAGAKDLAAAKETAKARANESAKQKAEERKVETKAQPKADKPYKLEPKPVDKTVVDKLADEKSAKSARSSAGGEAEKKRAKAEEMPLRELSKNVAPPSTSSSAPFATTTTSPLSGLGSVVTPAPAPAPPLQSAPGYAFSTGDAEPSPPPPATVTESARLSPPPPPAQPAAGKSDASKAPLPVIVDSEELKRRRQAAKLGGKKGGAPVDIERARREEQAGTALATGQMELSAGRYSSALDEMLRAEKLDTYRVFGAAAVVGQMRALQGLKRPVEVVKLGQRLSTWNLQAPEVVTGIALAADTAEKIGDTRNARSLWTVLLKAPSHKAAAQKALARLREPPVYRQHLDAEASVDAAEAPASAAPAESRE